MFLGDGSHEFCNQWIDDDWDTGSDSGCNYAQHLIGTQSFKIKPIEVETEKAYYIIRRKGKGESWVPKRAVSRIKRGKKGKLTIHICNWCRIYWQSSDHFKDAI